MRRFSSRCHFRVRRFDQLCRGAWHRNDSGRPDILHELSGIDRADLTESATFLELGHDSLFLAQFSAKIEERLEIQSPVLLPSGALATLPWLNHSRHEPVLPISPD